MIELQNVHKSFGSNHVLRGVDVSVNKGKSLVIIGGSGTGKSVTIKCILGLVKPDQGKIFVDGQDVNSAERDAFLARFGMLFQGGALFDSLTIWQNVAFRLLRGRLKKPQGEARAIAIEKLRRVVPASRLLVEFSERLMTAEGWARVCAFLGLTHIAADKERKVHEGAKARMDAGLAADAVRFLKDQYDWVADNVGPLPMNWQNNLARAYA